MKIIFWYGTKSLGPAQYVNPFLVWHKKSGSSQNILGPLKGRGKGLDNFWLFAFFRLGMIDVFNFTEFSKKNLLHSSAPLGKLGLTDFQFSDLLILIIWQENVNKWKLSRKVKGIDFWLNQKNISFTDRFYFRYLFIYRSFQNLC